MPMYRMRPSKAEALLTAVFGVLLLLFGITQFVGQPFTWFSVIWVAGGIAILGSHLRAGFGKGSGRWLSPTAQVDENAGSPRDGQMPPQGHEVRPSKTIAVAGVLFAVAVMALTVARSDQVGEARSFLVIWFVLGAAIIGIRLWAAFSKSGSSDNAERRD